MKYKILEILNVNKGSFVSGQKICDELGISRTAVWKNIKSLSSEGYMIESAGGKGYSIHGDADVLNEYEINKRLKSALPVYYFNSLDSTNNKAKEIAADVDSEISLVTCSIQKSGRGRMGRTFESDTQKGIWCSFILKPNMEPEKTLLITIAAATAVAKTINSLYGIAAGIKWPNDIIIKGKKVAGILTEMNCETNTINYIVLGIGINISQSKKDFTEQTAKIAESLYGVTGRKVLRSEMIASLCYNIKEVYGFITERHTEKIIDLWNKYTITDGKKITIYKNKEEIPAKAIGIDEQGMLIAKKDTGEVIRYNSGEISIRGITGHIEREI